MEHLREQIENELFIYGVSFVLVNTLSTGYNFYFSTLNPENCRMTKEQDGIIIFNKTDDERFYAFPLYKEGEKGWSIKVIKNIYQRTISTIL